MKVSMFFITGFCGEQTCCFGEPESWSSCDKSCGGGQRKRRKEIIGIHNNAVSAAFTWIGGGCPLYEEPCINYQYDYQGCNNAPCRKFMICKRFMS